MASAPKANQSEAAGPGATKYRYSSMPQMNTHDRLAFFTGIDCHEQCLVRRSDVLGLGLTLSTGSGLPNLSMNQGLALLLFCSRTCVGGSIFAKDLPNDKQNKQNSP